MIVSTDCHSDITKGFGFELGFLIIVWDVKCLTSVTRLSITFLPPNHLCILEQRFLNCGPRIPGGPQALLKGPAFFLLICGYPIKYHQNVLGTLMASLHE